MNMPLKATDMQRIFDVVKVWWFESFRSQLVNGQHALTCNFDARMYAYLSRYVSKLVPEFPVRGVTHLHSHCVVIRRLGLEGLRTVDPAIIE